MQRCIGESGQTQISSPWSGVREFRRSDSNLAAQHFPLSFPFENGCPVEVSFVVRCLALLGDCAALSIFIGVVQVLLTRSGKFSISPMYEAGHLALGIFYTIPGALSFVAWCFGEGKRRRWSSERDSCCPMCTHSVLKLRPSAYRISCAKYTSMRFGGPSVKVF